MGMRITRDDMQWAASQGLITPRQADDVWRALEARLAGQIDTSATTPASPVQAPTRARFDAAHVAYYFGALLVIGAMGWLMTTAWEELGGGGVFVIATIYAVCFWLAGRTLWDRNGLIIPGGLLFTMSVCMTPLAVYGLERMLNLWPTNDPGIYRGFHVWVKSGWLMMEAATIVAGLIALRFRRFPFLTAPIAFSLWYMSMDLTPLVFGDADHSWRNREWVSMMFGFAMLLASYLVDLRGTVEEDFAFWGYLFGLMAFWGGLSLMDSGDELSKLGYAFVNVKLITLSVFLRQRSFIVFGSLGVMGYTGHLAYRVFENSLLFPFVVTIAGLLVIYLGVVYQRHRSSFEAYMRSSLPDSLRQLVPVRARASY